MKKRKTHDEYDLMGDYGCGLECILTEENVSEAKKRLKEHLENDRFVTGLHIRKRRVRNEA